MFLITTLIVLALLPQAARQSQPTCGTESQLLHRAVKRVLPPWTVEIIDARQRMHVCVGTVVNERWVVTAAHCVNPARKGAYLVLSGSMAQDNHDPTESDILSIQTHKDYDDAANVSAFDVAVYGLATPIPSWSVCYDMTTNYTFHPDAKCVLKRWNRSSGEPESHHFRYSTFENCSDSKGDPMLCLRATGDDGLCAGESGTPLLCAREDGHYYLTAIVVSARVAFNGTTRCTLAGRFSKLAAAKSTLPYFHGLLNM